MTRCNRCDFTATRDDERPPAEQLAEHATDTGHWLCSSCGRSLADTDPRMACETCLTDARSLLADCVLLFDELPRHLRTVAGTALGGTRGSSGHALPGGQVLSLLGPGSPGGAARRLTRTDKERGEEGREHRFDNRPEDAPSVAWTLASWEDAIRHERGDDPAMTGTSVSRVVQGSSRYLEVHARWAANNLDAFDEFLSDLRDLHARLEVACHRKRRPTKAGADCFTCGGPLIRRVVDGLEEEWVTCTVCHEQYDPSRYTLALKAAAEDASRLEQAGEAYATPAALASLLGRSERTLRTWHRRGQVSSVERGGVLFLNVGEVSARHAERAKGKTA